MCLGVGKPAFKKSLYLGKTCCTALSVKLGSVLSVHSTNDYGALRARHCSERGGCNSGQNRQRPTVVTALERKGTGSPGRGWQLGPFLDFG